MHAVAFPERAEALRLSGLVRALRARVEEHVGMDGILCALSAKRRALLEEDPDLLSEVIGARHRERIRGLMDIGKAWHALDLMLGEGEDPVLGDAVLARSGTHFGPSMAFGRPRLLEPARVAEVAEALAELPSDFIGTRYATLRGRNAHGGYGPKPRSAAPEEYADELAELDVEADEETSELEELGEVLQRLIVFYREAAVRRDSIVAIVV